MRTSFSTGRGLALACVLVAAGTGIELASAHGDATGIVLERHTLMTELRDASKVVGAMVRGKQTLDRDELAMNAKAMADLATRLAGLFPDNEASRQGAGNSTRQKAWLEFTRFESLAEELAHHTSALAESADSATTEQLLTRVRALGDTCKQCHKSYRRKKKH